ncbi:copper homeostasis protein CutC [Flavobacteriaceae bacterium LMO-SS05]
MTLEICASNYQSAANAQIAGAQRIELCSELAVGGLTPSYGLLKQVLENLSLSVFVLIRPRSGNFTYSKAELDIMKQDIQLCKDLGCSGIVSGVLNREHTIDMERTQQLIELSKPLAFTFHRAFDWTPDPFEALNQLIDLKAERILTSGQESSAEKGLKLLNQLNDKAKNHITILPGGGITMQNANLFKAAGFTEIHASASSLNVVNEHPKISMNSPQFFDETLEVVSDVGKIKGILKSISK